MIADLYVLTVERDCTDPSPLQDGRPIVFEQHLDNGAASLESVTARKDRIGDKYGKCRIARLVFLDGEA